MVTKPTPTSQFRDSSPIQYNSDFTFEMPQLIGLTRRFAHLESEGRRAKFGEDCMSR
jgi:hypothetical protein